MPALSISFSPTQSPALIAHLVWMAYLAVNLGFVKSLAFFAVAQCGCGLFLALVFGLGHNGMATYDADARPDFWKLQVRCCLVFVGAGPGPGCWLLVRC